MLKVLALLAVVFAVVYLVVTLVQRRPGGGSGAPRRRPPAVPPQAPDDDPSFLRDLDDRLWREKQARGPDENEGPAAEPDSTPTDPTPEGTHDTTQDDRQTPP